jgi:Tfp pilus assembly protein PilN
MRAPKLTLEFAPGVVRVSWLGRAMLLASLALLAHGLMQLAEVWSARARAITNLTALDANRLGSADTKTRPLKPDPAQLANSRAAQQVAQSLMTPWSDLLESLGSARTEAVALLAVEPSVAKHSVRLSAEARNWHEMLVYVGALQRDSRLTSVVLVSHQVQVQAPGTPVRFQVQANWGESR